MSWARGFLGRVLGRPSLSRCGKVLDMKADPAERIVLDDGGELALFHHDNLESEEEKKRNIFRLDGEGEIVWQVGEYDGADGVETFTGLIAIADGVLQAFNFNGGVYGIDIGTGVCRPLGLIK